jgi:hypothetical protein
MRGKRDSDGNWRPCKCYFRYVEDDNKQWLYNVGIFHDGELYNPNKYSEDVVRDAIARRQEKIKANAKATRERRRQKLIYQAGKHILAGGNYGPRHSCYICHKAMFDAPSVTRGIGPECWDHVLSTIEHLKQQQQSVA